jgi:hypothetical protein
MIGRHERREAEYVGRHQKHEERPVDLGWLNTMPDPHFDGYPRPRFPVPQVKKIKGT